MIALLLALSEADQPMLVYWIIGAILVVGQSLQGWVALMTYFASRKVDTAQFVTKAELALHKAERDQQMKVTFDYLKEEIGKISSTVQNLDREWREELPSIHRALGKLEGHDEADGPAATATATPPVDKRSRRRR